MGRAPCCQKVGLKTGRWTTEEDKILMNYIQIHGEGSWRSLPKNAGLLRCGKSCRLRWINYLRSDLKRGNISCEEEETIIKLHASLGNRWSLIASHLPRRTDNEIKNYWNSCLSRKIIPTTNTSNTPIPTELSSHIVKHSRTRHPAMKINKTYKTSIKKVVVNTHKNILTAFPTLSESTTFLNGNTYMEASTTMYQNSDDEIKMTDFSFEKREENIILDGVNNEEEKEVNKIASSRDVENGAKFTCSSTNSYNLGDLDWVWNWEFDHENFVKDSIGLGDEEKQEDDDDILLMPWEITSYNYGGS